MKKSKKVKRQKENSFYLFCLLSFKEYETDYRRLLDSPEIDALLVSLPIYKNAAITRECLAAGKHVLCEKPLAHELDEAKALRDFAAQASAVLLVGENYYFNPQIASLAETHQYPDFDNGFRNEWQAFYDAIHHRQPFPSTATQCYADQVLITAMLDSASRREIVHL